MGGRSQHLAKWTVVLCLLVTLTAGTEDAADMASGDVSHLDLTRIDMPPHEDLGVSAKALIHADLEKKSTRSPKADARPHQAHNEDGGREKSEPSAKTQNQPAPPTRTADKKSIDVAMPTANGKSMDPPIQLGQEMENLRAPGGSQAASANADVSVPSDPLGSGSGSGSLLGESVA